MEKIGINWNAANFRLPDRSARSTDEYSRTFSRSTDGEKIWDLLKNSSNKDVTYLVSLAEEWAIVMQQQLSRNIPLELIWLETFKEAQVDPDSRSLGKAVGYLSRYWEHGLVLRQLYDQHEKTALDNASPDAIFYDHGVL